MLVQTSECHCPPLSTPPPCFQPASEPDWRTNPFELNAVNEYLYGRGTSDNKVSPDQAHVIAA